VGKTRLVVVGFARLGVERSSVKNKQRASLRGKGTPRKQKAQRKTRNRSRRVNNNTNPGMGGMGVPVNTAFIVQNRAGAMRSGPKGVCVSGKEIIGTFPFLTNDEFDNLGKFPTVSFNLNPLEFEGTRLQTLAKAFQKYRFTNKTKLTLQTQAPSIATGSYVVGYSENPDQDMGSGEDALRSISALDGASSGPIWVAQTIPARISDRSKWYNVDSDTAEVMMAIQGKFVVQQTSPVSIIGNSEKLVAPVWLEWEVEFAGQAVQIVGGQADNTTFILPSGVFELAPNTNNVFKGFGMKYTLATSTIANQVTVGHCYQMVPGLEISSGETAEYIWPYAFGSGLVAYLLAGSLDQAEQSQFYTAEQSLDANGRLEAQGATCNRVIAGNPTQVSRLAAIQDVIQRFTRLNTGRSLMGAGRSTLNQ